MADGGWTEEGIGYLMTRHMGSVKPCGKEDIGAVMDFFGREWSKTHLMASRKDCIDYFFYNAERGNYNIIISLGKTGTEVNGILSYVTNTRFDSNIKDEDKFIWLCNWLASENSPKGTGLMLYSGLVSYENAKMLGTVGCNEKAELLYKAMRYKTGELEHYYLLNDSLNEFSVISGHKPECELNTEPYENNSIFLELLCSKPDKPMGFTENVHPKKTVEYILNKYKDNPYRKYFIYAIRSEEKVNGLFVVRTAEKENSKVLRIIDFLGDSTCLCGLRNQLLELCRSFDSEYIDMYCSGIPREILYSSGFKLVEAGGNLIVPDYFEPYLNKNIQIRYAYNFGDLSAPGERGYIFRGDCDREHPNFYYEN